jgi:PAS domain S-box-containing protein
MSGTGDLENFFENGAVPLHIVGADGTILRANRAELAFVGYETGEYIGRSIREFHADTAAIEDILARLSRGEKVERYPAKLRAKDGSIKLVEVTSSVQLDEGGRFLNTRCFTFDVTALREVEEAMQQQQEQMRQVLSALPAAVYMTDKNGIITYFNKAAEELAGRTPEIGKDQWCVTWRLRDLEGTPLPHDQCPMAIAIKEQRPVRGGYAYAERPDGSIIPFAPYPTPLFDAKGDLSGAVNMLIDISEQHEYEAHIELVMRELSHRSKNLMTIMQSFAGQLMKFCDSLPEFQEKFTTRLQAMARMHDLLVASEWIGADIRTIVDGEVRAFIGSATDRVEYIGSDMILNPGSAQNLSVAVHELATNAIKYGALADELGTIKIGWQPTEDNAILFTWLERPRYKVESPGRHGFGLHMLGLLFQEAQFDFEQEGFRFRGRLPYSRIVDDSLHRRADQRSARQ